ncbi:MAG: hypothetical protein KJ645_02840 [Planctomycetes bacterium]|nr:hypothetical protein [Planctomycetota bacterium]
MGSSQWLLVKSTDGGASWPTEIPVSDVGNYTTYGQAFDIARTDSSIMFFGGVYNGTVMVRRSGDSGTNWTDVTSNLSTFHASNDFLTEIWISPEDADRVLVASKKGVFLTEDAGTSWAATSINDQANDFVYDVAFDTLYAASKTGVYQSTDQGGTWSAMNDGLEVLEVTCIEFDPHNGYLFAGTAGGSVWRYELSPATLWANYDEVPETVGGTVDLMLNATAANAFRYYLIVGGASGTEPGFPLPGGLAALPINWDWFSDIEMSLLNIEPYFAQFMAKLDADGKSHAKFTAPPMPPGTAGLRLHFAFCCNNPFDYVSNVVMVEVADY